MPGEDDTVQGWWKGWKQGEWNPTNAVQVMKPRGLYAGWWPAWTPYGLALVAGGMAYTPSGLAQMMGGMTYADG